jgi:hypothetical protein
VGRTERKEIAKREQERMILRINEGFYQKFKKWLFMSVLVGVLPVIIRLILYIGYVTQRTKLSVIDIGDTLVFGLVLNIGNLYQMDDLSVYEKADLVEFTGSSIVRFAVFVVLYVVYILNPLNPFSEILLIFLTILFNFSTILITLRHFNMEKLKNESIV